MERRPRARANGSDPPVVRSVSWELGTLGGPEQTDPLDPGHPLRPRTAQRQVPVWLLDGQQHDRAADFLVRIDLLFDSELVDEVSELPSVRHRIHFFPCQLPQLSHR
jgi:hypothetical protein